MRIIPFRAKDLEWLIRQGHLKMHVSVEQLVLLEKTPYTYTIQTDEGKILACGGIVKYWDGRGELWIAFNRDSREYFLEIHHAVKRYLKTVPFRRIEAAVELGFEQGHRWMKTLGFKKEADRLEAYLPNGKDCALYARVR